MPNDQSRVFKPLSTTCSISTLPWRQRPIESADTVHVLPVLRLLDLAHGIIPVVPGHFRILCGAEVLESHHSRHLGFGVFILSTVSHLYIARDCFWLEAGSLFRWGSCAVRTSTIPWRAATSESTGFGCVGSLAIARVSRSRPIVVSFLTLRWTIAACSRWGARASSFVTAFAVW